MDYIETPRATLSVQTTEGFSVLVTITNAMTNKELVDLMEQVKLASIKAKEAGFVPKADRYPLSTSKPITGQKTPSPVQQTQGNQDDEPATKICPVHEVTMYKKSGRTGIFYSHYDKERGYCSGRGYKDEKQY